MSKSSVLTVATTLAIEIGMKASVDVSGTATPFETPSYVLTDSDYRELIDDADNYLIYTP